MGEKQSQEYRIILDNLEEHIWVTMPSPKTEKIEDISISLKNKDLNKNQNNLFCEYLESKRKDIHGMNRMARFINDETKIIDYINHCGYRIFRMDISNYVDSKKLVVNIYTDNKISIGWNMKATITVINRRVIHTKITYKEIISDIDTMYAREFSIKPTTIKEFNARSSKHDEEVQYIIYEYQNNNRKTLSNKFYTMAQRVNFIMEAIINGKILCESVNFIKTDEYIYRSTYIKKKTNDNYYYEGKLFQVINGNESIRASLSRQFVSKEEKIFDKPHIGILDFKDYDFRETLFKNASEFSIMKFDDVEIINEKIEYNSDFLKEKFNYVNKMPAIKSYYYHTDAEDSFILEVSLVELYHNTPSSTINQYYKLIDTQTNTLYSIEPDFYSKGLGSKIYTIASIGTDKMSTTVKNILYVDKDAKKVDIISKIRYACEVTGVYFS